ncbi:MAG: OmpA-like protein [Bacteroidota bacterium]|nr:OmpA-like protein [Bacteroidota bacterium]
MQKVITILLIITAAAVIGCSPGRPTSPKPLFCPIPAQDCNPEKWSGLIMDTSAESARLLGFYYRIEPVQQINSPDDDWQLSFISPRKAYFTFNDVDRQSVMLVRRIDVNKYAIESGVGFPFEGNIGAITIAGDSISFSAEVLESRKAESSIETSKNEKDNYLLLPHERILGNSKIYSGRIEGNLVSNVSQLKGRMQPDSYNWESQPALTPDGSALFFASDRIGSLAGTDIWFSIRLSDGSWSEPINCGDSVNSQCDELTPFVTSDGKKLLFSSSGHSTVGGYDIFSAEISSQIYKNIANKDISELKRTGSYFSNVQNLRPPLNTPADELFPGCPGNCDSILYYSSNQSGSEKSLVQLRGGFDLYVRHKIVLAEMAPSKERVVKPIEVNLPTEINIEDKIKMPDAPTLPFYTLEGTVYNAKTQDVVPFAELTVKELPSAEIKKQFNANEKGWYEVQLEKQKSYEITAQAEHLFFDSYKIQIDDDIIAEHLSRTQPPPLEEFRISQDKSDKRIIHIIKDFHVPETLILRINFPFDNFNDPYRFVLDSNGVEINRSWQEELDLLAQNILKYKVGLLKISLVGNTDDVGTVEYNNRLGKRRVDFVIRQLILRGVSEELLEGRSAGELEPLPQRQDENIEIWRKRLRRVSIDRISTNK